MHFDHHNVIKYCNRPFQNVEEMNETITRNWNNTVNKQDEVYILGDISFNNADKYLERLNGRKYLIRGNHDNKTKKSEYLTWIKDYHELKYNGAFFILFHYPIEEWNGYFRESIHLHGHQHNKEAVTAERRIDVGVDAWNFTPISITQIIEKIK